MEWHSVDSQVWKYGFKTMNAEPISAAPHVDQLDLLFQKLQAAEKASETGYWTLALASGDSTIHLAIALDKVVFAGGQQLSGSVLLQTLQRYIPQLRTLKAREATASLKKSHSVDCDISSHSADCEILGRLVGKLEKLTGISHQMVTDALMTQILVTCDQLWEGVQDARFTPDPQLFLQAPIDGITLEDLIAKMQVRHQEWQPLKSVIPTMEAIPILNSAALEKASLSAAQKQQVEKLASLGRPLSVITKMTAQDPLTTTKTFANLIRGGLVSLQIPADLLKAIPSKSEIFIVDDSTLFLQKFQSLVSGWGYQVTVCSNTEAAIETMIAVQPDLIFLDINMPGMSGFDLIKAVRREAQLTEKNLVLLTAENSLSNQWRAKWGNCNFLAKPRTPEEIETFQSELKQLIQATISAA
jgi:CheY-like chemotaxis protein